MNYPYFFKKVYIIIVSFLFLSVKKNAQRGIILVTIQSKTLSLIVYNAEIPFEITWYPRTK